MQVRDRKNLACERSWQSTEEVLPVGSLASGTAGPSTTDLLGAVPFVGSIETEGWPSASAKHIGEAALDPQEDFGAQIQAKHLPKKGKYGCEVDSCPPFLSAGVDDETYCPQWDVRRGAG